jgi:hypothetical protein
MPLMPIAELGVSQAYELLLLRFGCAGLPPIEAIENEDWGRDYLLSKLVELGQGALADAGLTAGSGEA